MEDMWESIKGEYATISFPWEIENELFVSPCLCSKFIREENSIGNLK